MDFAMRRITRAALEVVEKPSVEVTKKRKSKKKVQFEDSVEDENKILRILSVSVVSDEGIDMTFSPLPESHSSILKPRHPLPHSWTFWYSAGNKRLSWKQNQKKISSVATIEDFWLTYNQVKLASDLPAGYTYSVFRSGILPDWEDVGNREGGRWMASFDKKERKELLDNRWLEVLYMLLGEQVEEGGGKIVVGAEACVRKKGDRLEVWVGDVDSMEGVVKTGRMLKSKLMMGAEDKIEFSLHREEKEGEEGVKLML
jgi:translation initiation factor 4E